MKKNKVTLLISSLAGGGAEGVCVNLANGLVARGWEVDLLVLHLRNSEYLTRVNSKVNLVNLGVSRARNSWRPLLQYIKFEKPQTILVFNYELAILVLLIRLVISNSFKVIARNVNTLSEKRKLAKGAWHKVIVLGLIDRLYKNVDHVINQCSGMETDLLQCFPSLSGKTSVIYNPVNESLLDDSVGVSEMHGSTLQSYLLYVGRLEPQKDVQRVINIFSLLPRKYSYLRLKIVGKGSLEEALKKQVKDLKLEDRVDFEGFQGDLRDYYKNANATVLASLFEGFPNVLVESICLGTPVISHDCKSGPNEIIRDKFNGYLVPYQDDKSFSMAIRNLLEGVPRVIGKNDVLAGTNKYSLNHAISKYVECIESS